MTLVDRLRIVAEDLESEDATKSAEAVRAAIARIEAADDLSNEMPRDPSPLNMPDNDVRRELLAYRALVREQEE